ncbi:hypothetical protein Q1W73_13675 [Asticcacaulis sp. ZE23SCel15]|uniref:hypothetical protein n=1 Tax=Asticcacaulis sp. ZE23SCel15 TaxID=3059027 RepID=UPI00265FFA72|nr:hypothetical protein [Asticcacaulis sp. ZE23SCel15]WKL56710.1 hypothetical protein Q1W73_13675 [Asticcacaulis sp. ZE23SCel15]
MFQNFSGSKLTFVLAATAAAGLSPHATVAQSTADGSVRFRIEGFAGSTTDTRPIATQKDKDSKGLLPSMSFSYGETFKGQFDLLAAEHAGDKSVAGAAHLGFKASAHTTLGVYASKTRIKTPAKLNSERVGLELVYQGDKTAFNWIAGHEKVGAATVVAGTIPGYTVVDTYGDKDGFFNLADVTYYPRPNWALTLGHRYGSGRHGGVAGIERANKWKSSTVSLFAEGRFGDKAYSGAWVGLRVRFGGNGASLRAVRDQETYTNHLKDDMYGIGNSRRRTDVALPPPPPEDDDNDCVCGACYAT